MNIQSVLNPMDSHQRTPHPTDMPGGITKGCAALHPYHAKQKAILHQVLGPLSQDRPDQLVSLVDDVMAQIPAREWEGIDQANPHQVWQLICTRTRVLCLEDCNLTSLGDGIMGLLNGAKRIAPGDHTRLKVRHAIEGVQVSMTQYMQWVEGGMDERQCSQLELILTSEQELRWYAKVFESVPIDQKPPIVAIDPSVELAGQSMRFFHLLGCDLAHRTLEGSDLTGACLENTVLMGSNFRHAILEGARVSGANLARTCLVGARLRGADLTNATVIESGLSAAQLRSCASFDGILMTVSEWIKVSTTPMGTGGMDGEASGHVGTPLIPETARSFRQHDWHNVRVVIQSHDEWQSLTGYAKKPMVHCIDPSVQLAGTQIQGLDMSDIVLSNRALNRMTLQDVLLDHAQLVGCGLNKATIHRGLMTGANLSQVQGCGLTLHTVDMKHAILMEGVFFDATFECVTLSHAVMTGAVLDQARFRHVALSYVNLCGMDLTRMAEWQRVSLRHSRLIGTQLSREQWQAVEDCEWALVSMQDYDRTLALGVPPQQASTLCVLLMSLQEVRVALQLNPMPRLKLASVAMAQAVKTRWPSESLMPVSLYQAIWAHDPVDEPTIQVAIPAGAWPSLHAKLQQLETGDWVDLMTQLSLKEHLMQTRSIQLVMLLPSLHWESASIYELDGIVSWLAQHDTCPYTRQPVTMAELIPLAVVIRSLSHQYPEAVNATQFPTIWQWVNRSV